MCYRQWNTKGVTLLCVLKMNARDIFSSIRQVHRSTRISKGARREIAVDSDNYVHQKQTTAILVCYYFIILLVILNVKDEVKTT